MFSKTALVLAMLLCMAIGGVATMMHHYVVASFAHFFVGAFVATLWPLRRRRSGAGDVVVLDRAPQDRSSPVHEAWARVVRDVPMRVLLMIDAARRKDIAARDHHWANLCHIAREWSVLGAHPMDDGEDLRVSVRWTPEPSDLHKPD